MKTLTAGLKRAAQQAIIDSYGQHDVVFNYRGESFRVIERTAIDNAAEYSTGIFDVFLHEENEYSDIIKIGEYRNE